MRRHDFIATLGAAMAWVAAAISFAFALVLIGLGLLLMALHGFVDLLTPYEDAPSLRLLLGAVSTEPVVDVILAAGLTWASHSSVAVVLVVMSFAAKGVVPPESAFALVLGAKLGANTYSAGTLLDPALTELGENCIVGHDAVLFCHAIEGPHFSLSRICAGDNVTIGVLGRLTTALAKLNGANLLKTPSGGVPDLYLTEYGYLRAGKRKMAEPKRAKYLVQAFGIAQRNPHVREMLHYLLVRPTKGLAFFDTSLATRSGKPGAAFKSLAGWARQAASAGQITTVSRPSGGGGGGGSTGGGGSGGGSGGQCTVVAGIPICP